MIDGKQYLTAQQVAELLQKHVQTIYNWGREGKLKTRKIGYAVLFPSDQFEEKGG
jgi:excisionase family DNA binding protein